MKIRNVVLSSVAGMLLTSSAVYSLTPAGGHATAATAQPAIGAEAVPGPAGPLSSFNDGTTLAVEGRLGHAQIAKGARGQTYLMLEVRGGESARATTAAPSHLAIVIDRSGSMKGDRLVNARLGAKAAVDRLGEGDLISVIAFDTRTNVVVPATRIDADARTRVKAAIDGINLGGDTCISCGIEEGMRELARSNDKVDRMIVLSDGDATDGVRDVGGFRAIAQRARGMGCAISTIGVGLGYNQRILGAVAQEASGGHYFIEDTTSLDRVFTTEAEALRSTVAVEAEAVIDPGEGVDVRRVIDRGFERRGRKIVVPLGGFAKGEVKTVLVEIDVPTRAEGPMSVASVDVGYRDLTRGERAISKGTLGISIGDATADLDPIVAGRVARAGTAAALLQANDLAARGDLDGAQRVLADQKKTVALAAAAPRPNKLPAGRAKDFDNDIQSQAGSLDNASRGLTKSAPKADVSRSVRRNEEVANPFMR